MPIFARSKSTIAAAEHHLRSGMDCLLLGQVWLCVNAAREPMLGQQRNPWGAKAFSMHVILCLSWCSIGEV